MCVFGHQLNFWTVFSSSLYSPDWATGLEYWTGILDWNTGLEYWTGLLDWVIFSFKYVAFWLGCGVNACYIVSTTFSSLMPLGRQHEIKPLAKVSIYFLFITDHYE